MRRPNAEKRCGYSSRFRQAHRLGDRRPARTSRDDPRHESGPSY